MNLTQSIKRFLVTRFCDGATIKECAMWYEQRPEKVESVIREALREATAPKYCTACHATAVLAPVPTEKNR